jgi:hypothetical protein
MEEQIIDALLAHRVGAIVDKRDGDIVTLWVTDGWKQATIRLIPDRMPPEPPLDVWAGDIAAWLAA